MSVIDKNSALVLGCVFCAFGRCLFCFSRVGANCLGFFFFFFPVLLELFFRAKPSKAGNSRPAIYTPTNARTHPGNSKNTPKLKFARRFFRRAWKLTHFPALLKVAPTRGIAALSYSLPAFVHHNANGNAAVPRRVPTRTRSASPSARALAPSFSHAPLRFLSSLTPPHINTALLL